MSRKNSKRRVSRKSSQNGGYNQVGGGITEERLKFYRTLAEFTRTTMSDTDTDTDFVTKTQLADSGNDTDKLSNILEKYASLNKYPNNSNNNTKIDTLMDNTSFVNRLEYILIAFKTINDESNPNSNTDFNNLNKLILYFYDYLKDNKNPNELTEAGEIPDISDQLTFYWELYNTFTKKYILNTDMPVYIILGDNHETLQNILEQWKKLYNKIDNFTSYIATINVNSIHRTFSQLERGTKGTKGTKGAKDHYLYLATNKIYSYFKENRSKLSVNDIYNYQKAMLYYYNYLYSEGYITPNQFHYDDSIYLNSEIKTTANHPSTNQ